MNYSVSGTQYLGIYVERDGNNWWIVDDNGSETYVGHECPTTEQVTAYRNSLNLNWRQI